MEIRPIYDTDVVHFELFRVHFKHINADTGQQGFLQPKPNVFLCCTDLGLCRSLA